jgi:hypothetical protein
VLKTGILRFLNLVTEPGSARSEQALLEHSEETHILNDKIEVIDR